MEFIEVKKDHKTMLIAIGIKGLVSEGELLREKMQLFKPDIILMGISPEEVEGMKNFIDDPFEIDMSDYELIYGTILSKFGEVEIPPPIFTQPIIYAKEHDIPVKGLDVDEETFGDRYEDEYTVSQMVGFITKKRKLKKKNFDLTSPEAFVNQWKNEIEKTRAMRNMEKLREGEIVKNMYNLFVEGNEGKYFAVIEYEFSEEVKRKTNYM
ncbi:MAG: hypothetical protein ACYCSO_09400 [Cuniculiplasma sp.]